MNGFLGIIRFDGKPVTERELRSSAFTSPLWQADHESIVIDQHVGFTSTQRFLTNECSRAPMPYKSPITGDIIVGSAFLSNYNELLDLLGHKEALSDIELVYAAYYKWGSNCTTYLKGNFVFGIWNKQTKQLFLAVDHFGRQPCFYSYSPGKYFIFSNTMYPFPYLCDKTTLNPTMITRFAIDSPSFTETCYQEVNKLKGAHQLHLSPSNLELTNYWALEEELSPIRYRKKQEYYEHFEELFYNTTKQYIRTDYEVSAHISGGLDSSSIACIAAKILNKQDKRLYGFTAIPNDLSKKSSREGWRWHELDIVQSVLNEHSNIIHATHQLPAETDIHESLRTYFRFIDKPIRNTANFEWIIASLCYARSNNSRILLSGREGNSTISFQGDAASTLRKYLSKNLALKKIKALIDKKLNNDHARDKNRFQIDCYRDSFLNSEEVIKIQRHDKSKNRRYYQLAQEGALKHWSTSYPIHLYHGINVRDPTANIDIVRFCLNIPNNIFCIGKKEHQRRLLVRKGLRKYVSTTVLKNTFRGEQGTDWQLSYTKHHIKWRNNLLKSHQYYPILQNMCHTDLLNKRLSSKQLYEKESKENRSLYMIIMRHLSLCYFLQGINETTCQRESFYDTNSDISK